MVKRLFVRGGLFGAFSLTPHTLRGLDGEPRAIRQTTDGGRRAMDATRARRTRDRARQRWYARHRQLRFARFLGFAGKAADQGRDRA
jgi:hypothetical protein